MTSGHGSSQLQEIPNNIEPRVGARIPLAFRYSAPMKACIRALILTCLAAPLTGCGVRSTYDNLDWLAVRWLDAQVDLSTEQERFGRGTVERKLAWHCASELPDYIALIERIEEDVATGQITVDALNGYSREISALGRRLLVRAHPTVAEFLTNLDDRQVEQLIENIRERNQELELVGQEQTPEQRRAEFVDGMESGLRRLLGRLNPNQRARLEQWAEARHPTSAFDRERRRAHDRRLIEALATRHDPFVFEQRLNALFNPTPSNEQPESDPARQATACNPANMLNTLVDIYELADDRQIRRLRNRLETLADDSRKLSCRDKDRSSS